MRATEVTAVFRFAFLVHPLDLKRDVARKYPIAKWLPESWVEALLRRMRVKVLGKITGVRSLTGATTEGWLLGIPMTAKMMLADERRALGLLAEACHLAADLGAHIVGLGAYTAIVGNNGVELQKMSPLPVTTGNSYTTWTAVEATKLAAEAMGIEWERATAAVVGATGSIGKACAFLLVNGTGDAGQVETTANAEGQMANSGVHLPPVAEVVLIGRNGGRGTGGNDCECRRSNGEQRSAFTARRRSRAHWAQLATIGSGAGRSDERRRAISNWCESVGADDDEHR